MHGVFGLSALVVACAGGSAQQPGGTVPEGVSIPPASSAAGHEPRAADASATGDADAVAAIAHERIAGDGGDAGDAGPKLCGCALCEPVVSDDACATDADCAPDQPCHAPRCVAKSKATPRRPGQMCTMILACTTSDANACSCVKNRCTLHAREDRKDSPPAPKK
jgi:hypothetical protein